MVPTCAVILIVVYYMISLLKTLCKCLLYVTYIMMKGILRKIDILEYGLRMF